MKTLRYILHNERGILPRPDLVYNNSQKEAGGKQMRKSRLLAAAMALLFLTG